MISSNVFEDISKDNIKMIFIVREDIKMSKGEVASYCAHGAIKSYVKAQEYYTDYLKRWIKSGQVKEVLGVDKETKMLDIIDNSKAMDINYCIVRDRETRKVNTVLVLGPAPSYFFESLIKSLKPF
ncbi:SWPV1-037 [Shearwaterpox virus]|uniref:peptidyl-tRNA hydrolase n=1 Tax=Shearwaterpox virus TaxID=1974596 RepID=A0A1V0S7P9_CNPV|nr:SWPV1-037 [Shearwaterpox virus]